MLTRYEDIMKAELEARRIRYPKKAGTQMLPVGLISAADEWIDKAVWQIFEVAKSAFVSRSYNSRYFLYGDNMVYESVSAHTNLVLAIASWAFEAHSYFTLGHPSNSVWMIEGYSLKDIEEAIRLHDLSENEIGDIPDNGGRDDEEKNALEMEYYEKYAERFPNETMAKRILRLLRSMQLRDSFVGKMVYLSDKVAALIITLCLDEIGHSPKTNLASPYASDRDRAEMRMCDNLEDGMYRASEMWTMDFFEMRELCQYDDTMFFTALIVAATLRVHKRWYRWRERSYQN